jgi:Effector-associated domain 1
MSIFTEPYNANDARIKDLLGIAITGYREKGELKVFIQTVGVDEIDVDWDGPVADVWPGAIAVVAKQGKLRALVEALRDDPNYAQVRARTQALLDAADREKRFERSQAGKAVDPFQATVVSGRPFVNRTRLRENLQTLFSDGGNQTMIVDGPPMSGRSYTWVLISHVARKAGSMRAYLFDLSTFKDTQMSPKDVAEIIAADLGWPKPEIDEEAQDETKGRVLLGWLKNGLQGIDPVCLVFDGLDGANLADATVSFIGDIAGAAGNDELGECRVALLAFGRALSNPGVDPFVLREPAPAAIPLADLMAFFKALAGEGGAELSDDQARALAERLFGSPPPDPVPVASMRDRASDIGQVASSLRARR